MKRFNTERMDARTAMKAATTALRCADAYTEMKRIDEAREARGAQPLPCSGDVDKRIEACSETVKHAESLLDAYARGNPGKRGAEALRLHYIGLMRWREVAEAMGLSESGARAAARAALSWLDAEEGGR